MSTNSTPKTLFSKIADREIPAVIVYEDDLTLAFLDHNPVTTGHLLVIPKQPVDHLDDCSEDLYAAVFKTVRLLSGQIKRSLKPERVILIVHGYEIPHAHVHVIPAYSHNDATFPARPDIFPSKVELQTVAEQLRQGL